MTLKHESVWRRLKSRLAYHEKLVEENREKQNMVRSERKIRRLISILECMNSREIILNNI